MITASQAALARVRVSFCGNDAPVEPLGSQLPPAMAVGLPGDVTYGIDDLGVGDGPGAIIRPVSFQDR